MENETLNDNNFMVPIIDDEQTGTLTCPSCGEKGQRPDRRSCMNCGQPFYRDARRCKVCGTPLSDVGFCETCGKSYWEIDLERADYSNTKRDNTQTRINKREILEKNLNVNPARWSMIASLVCSALVLIMLFLPTSKEILSFDAASHKVMDVIGKDLMRSVSPEEGRLAAVAAGGLFAACLMLVLNLIFLLKNNPMQRGAILYESIVFSPFVVWSLFMPIKRFGYDIPMKLNVIGIICICICVIIIALAIITYILLAKQSREVEKCLPYDNKKKYKTMSRKKILEKVA